MSPRRALTRALLGGIAVATLGVGCGERPAGRSEGEPTGAAARLAPASAGERPAREASPWEIARPGYAWSFPRDHRAHPAYRTEWWYFTGLLAEAGESEPRFGYQFTFFRIGLAAEPPELDSAWSTGQAIMGHAAVTDLATGRHVFSELLYRAAPLLGGFPDAPDPRLAWSRAPAGTDGTWTLSWTGEAFAFTAVDESRDVGIDLTAEPIRPVVLHGEGGLSTKGPAAGNASLYYSFPRMATTGEIALDGERRAVRGTSWMDKEIASNALAPDQVGWDWFSLRLEDGRDLMLYALRRVDGTVDHATGTLVGEDGSARPLEGEAFEIEATGSWTSPVTGSVYPSGWRIAVPSAGIELAVEPVVEAQENVSELLPDLHYWEGVVVARDAAGRVAGRGYVELTGYGEDSRPAL